MLVLVIPHWCVTSGILVVVNQERRWWARGLKGATISPVLAMTVVVVVVAVVIVVCETMMIIVITMRRGTSGQIVVWCCFH